MSGVNPVLAAVYGTNGASEEILEKSASDQEILDYVVKIAASNDIDMDELEDEDIVDLMKVAREHLAGEQSDAATDESADDTEKVAADAGEADEELEKMAAHADFMGRVMAHAFNQELESIADEAEKVASEEDPVVARAHAILEAANSVLESSEDGGAEEKTASEMAREVVADALAKEAADTELTAQALELLESEGFDVEKITDLLG